MSSSFTLDGIDHVAIQVRDVEQSARWYCDVLGLERRHADVWGNHPAVVGIGTTSLALFPVQGPHPQPPPGRDVLTMRHIAFRATRQNFEQALAALQTRGITPEIQDHRISRSLYFDDPDGHEIEITTYEVEKP